MRVDKLVGSRVLAWEKEFDYYRLVLDNARLVLFNPVVPPTGDLAGHVVTNVYWRQGVDLILMFDDGSTVSMSLRSEDYEVAEAGIAAYSDGIIEEIE